MHRWRPAGADDIPVIARISSVALAGYPEDEAIFVEMLGLSPDGCFVLEMEGAVSGYLIGHPWMRAAPPPLNTGLGSLPDAPDSWYLHDLSLLPSARGFGAARQAVALAASVARRRGLTNISLVAVNNAAGFWRSQGFAPPDDPRGDTGMAASLASYGSDAVYMERAL